MKLLIIDRINFGNVFSKKFYKLSLVIFTLVLGGCFANNTMDDEKYTCWVSKKNIDTCEPSKLSEIKGLGLVIKKSGAFCKARVLLTSAHKSQSEALGVNTNSYLRSIAYRCTWGDERFEEISDDGCEISGTIKRRTNMRTLKIDYKSCGPIEAWDKEGMNFYGVIDESYAKRTCEIFINKIPLTRVDRVEILPVDVIACEKFMSKAEMLKAYNTLIKSDILPRRELWQSICSQYSNGKNNCSSDNQK